MEDLVPSQVDRPLSGQDMIQWEFNGNFSLHDSFEKTDFQTLFVTSLKIPRLLPKHLILDLLKSDLLLDFFFRHG